MRKFKYLSIFFFVVSFILLFFLYNTVNTIKEKEIEKSKKILKKNTIDFTNLFTDFLISNAEKAAEFSTKLLKLKEKKEEINAVKMLYSYNKDIYSIQIYNNNRKLEFFYPPNSIPKDLEVDKLPRFKKLINNAILRKKLIFTTIFDLVEGGKAFGIFVPLFKKGEFVKGLFIIYKLPYILEKLKKNTMSFFDFNYAIIGDNYNILYSSNLNYVTSFPVTKITSEKCLKCHINMKNFEDIFLKDEKSWIDQFVDSSQVIFFSKQIKIYNKNWVLITAVKLDIFKKTWDKIFLIIIYISISIFVIFISFIVLILLLEKEIEKHERENKFLKKEIEKKRQNYIFNEITNIMESGNTGFFLHNGTDFVYVNPKLKSMFNISNEAELIQQIPPKERRIFESFLNMDKVFENFENSTTIEIKKDANNTNFYEINFYPIFIEGEKFIAGVVKDVSEQRNLYNQLQKESIYHFHLLKIIKSIVEKLDIEYFLTNISLEISKALNISEGYIFSISDRKIFPFSETKKEAFTSFSIEEFDLLTLKTAEKQKAVLYTKMSELIPWEISKIMRDKKIQNLAIIPIFKDTTPIYVIIVVNKNSMEIWGESELKFFQNIGNISEIFLKILFKEIDGSKPAYSVIFHELLTFLPCGIVIFDKSNKEIVFSNQKAWDYLEEDVENIDFFINLIEEAKESTFSSEFSKLKKITLKKRNLIINAAILEGKKPHYIFLIEEDKEE